MIRLLLDMGIAQSTGRHLRVSGHDVVHLLEEQLACLPAARVNVALDTALRAAGRSLEKGALVTITDRGIRVRVLPIDVP